MENAVSAEASEKLSKIDEVTETKLANISKGVDIDIIRSKQATFREVARCLGNIGHSAPHVGSVIIEQGALQILKSIYSFAHSPQTWQQVARAISNLSTNGNYLIFRYKDIKKISLIFTQCKRFYK